MGKKSKKRRLLYDRFSKNLRLTKLTFENSFPNISFEPDFDDGYICPICFRLFSIEALSDSYDNPLQLEHVPPGKLGGKVKLLTCKQCNNTDGSKLESHLKQKLHEYEFADGIPDSGIDIRGRIQDEADLAAILYNQGRNNFKIIFDPNPKRSHPKHVDKWHNIMATGNVPEFTLQIREGYPPFQAEVALLRIAYLWAFSTFGFHPLSPEIGAG